MGKTNLMLPNWMIKKFEYGKEGEDLCSIIVTCIAFYPLGLLCFFVFDPLGEGHLGIKIICAIIIGLLLIRFCYWIDSQISLLITLRKDAIDSYKNSKTDQEIHDAHLRLKKLHVPISVIRQK